MVCHRTCDKSDQDDHSSYRLHGVYYLKDRESRSPLFTMPATAHGTSHASCTTANSSISPMRPPCYPFLKVIAILRVIYESKTAGNRFPDKKSSRDFQKIPSFSVPSFGSYHGTMPMGQSQIENAVVSTFFITEFTIQK